MGYKARIAAAIALSIVALALTGCSWISHFDRGSSKNTEPSCELSSLRVSYGSEISPATGQNPVSVRLANLGTPCTLRGYPAATVLAENGRQLPFVIATSGDQMVPGTVSLPKGQAAWIRLNKYRCDLGSLAVGRRRRLAVAADADALTLVLDPMRPPGVGLDYCGRGDPGSTIHVFPFEPTEQATANSVVGN
jgi:hypothetical protein